MSTEKLERHKDVVREYYRIKNERDYEAIDDIFVEDFTTSFARHFGEEQEFDSEYLTTKWGEYVEAFPDLYYDVHNLVAEDEWVVARLHYRGTHEGELHGVEPTGERINVNQHLSFKFRNERIEDMYSTADFLTGLWRQIGVTPPYAREGDNNGK